MYTKQQPPVFIERSVPRSAMPLPPQFDQRKLRNPDREAYEAALARPWPSLTIMEPWASLIAGQYKLVENRTWKTNYRGPILIHAGVGPKWLHTVADFREQGYRLPDPLPLGRVVAVALLRDCQQLADIDVRWCDDPFAQGPWCWCLGGIVKLDEPIPMTGKQGIFQPPREVLEACKQLVAEAFHLDAE